MEYRGEFYVDRDCEECLHPDVECHPYQLAFIFLRLLGEVHNTTQLPAEVFVIEPVRDVSIVSSLWVGTSLWSYPGVLLGSISLLLGPLDHHWSLAGRGFRCADTDACTGRVCIGYLLYAEPAWRVKTISRYVEPVFIFFSDCHWLVNFMVMETT